MLSALLYNLANLFFVLVSMVLNKYTGVCKQDSFGGNCSVSSVVLSVFPAW
jgi:hypothetical protein